MLIESGRSKTLLGLRADDDESYVSAAIGQIAGIRLVEDNDQQSIPLKNRAGDRRRHVLLQPLVSHIQSDTQGGSWASCSRSGTIKEKSGNWLLAKSELN